MEIISDYVNVISTNFTRLEPNDLLVIVAKTALIALAVGLITYSFDVGVVAGIISFSYLVYAKTPPTSPQPVLYSAAPTRVRRAEAQLADLGRMGFEKALALLGQHRKGTVKEMNKYLREIRKIDADTANQIEEALREIRKEIKNPSVPKEIQKLIQDLSTEKFFSRTVRRIRYATV